jgi:NodT family efflux transporter outer membrane factor (OMF) lipoprotein
MGFISPAPIPRGINALRGFCVRRQRAAACGALILALVACTPTSVPVLRGDTPADWHNASASIDAAAPAPDLRNWWTAFNDPELDRLVDAALADNLTIRQAVLRIEAARTLEAHRNAGFLPQFGLHTYAEPTPDSSASYFQMGFDAKWEFGFFGRAQSQSRVSAGDLGIAESETQAARVSVVAEVARTYVELRGAQQRLGLLDQLAAATRDKVTLTATRQRLRMATANDVDRARVDQAAAEAALYEPRATIERCRQQLAVLLGRGARADDFVAVGDPPRLGDLRITTTPADLLRTRPEIQRAQSDVVKAAGELGLARADLYPSIGLGGSLTYAARVIGHTRLSDADGIVTFGPAIDIPLFDWGARHARADARGALLSASVLAYRQAVLEGVAEAETAMAMLEQQRERCVALAQGVAALESGEQSTATLNRLGLADGFDRIAASAAMLQARIDVGQAEQERNIAFIALYKSLGGAPLPEPETAAATATAAAASARAQQTQDAR